MTEFQKTVGKPVELKRDLLGALRTADRNGFDYDATVDMLAQAATAHFSNAVEGSLPVGTKVRKKKGYECPGVVVAVFTKIDGQVRYVVESTVLTGMLHVFGPNDVEEDKP